MLQSTNNAGPMDEALVERVARAIARATIEAAEPDKFGRLSAAGIEAMIENLAVKFYPEARAAITAIVTMPQPKPAAVDEPTEAMMKACPWPLDSDYGKRWALGWARGRSHTLSEMMPALERLAAMPQPQPPVDEPTDAMIAAGQKAAEQLCWDDVPPDDVVAIYLAMRAATPSQQPPASDEMLDAVKRVLEWFPEENCPAATRVGLGFRDDIRALRVALTKEPRDGR